MTSSQNLSEETQPAKKKNRTKVRSIRITPAGFGLLLAINILVLSLLAWPILQGRIHSLPSLNSDSKIFPAPSQITENVTSNQPTITPASPTPTIATSRTPTISPTIIPAQDEIDNATPVNGEAAFPVRLPTSLDQGTIILSISEGGHSHLFAYKPFTDGFIRLSEGPWDDITPTISPDRAYLAFASNRDQQWDLYLLELQSGRVIRLTNTPEYDGAPTWSPDSRFLAYETYVDDNLEIALIALPGDEDPIQITQHPAADFSPKWSPKGRQLAFISTRSGDREIWLANLDQASDAHYINISQSPHSKESNPSWSPNGEELAWASEENGLHNIILWQPGEAPNYLGSGDWPAWSPDGSTILTTFETPNQSLLTAYTISNGIIALPPLVSPGQITGLTWAETSLPAPLPSSFIQAAQFTPQPLWVPELAQAPDIPGGRLGLITLEDVQAAYPQIHDLVDESFQALRERAAYEAGWDLLATLENAFVPLTVPLPPGMEKDWLYTGRAFAFTPLPINAGWMVVVPEEFGTQTYWRVYLRARFQDGSQGKPLQHQPWDFNIRYNGDQTAYEQGGAIVGSIPSGYWVDFTELATSFNWERLHALDTWRSVYPAARWNEFAFTDGQDWHSAMLELYPPEALITPTIVFPATVTPTPTSQYHRTPTPTITPTPWPTLTPRYPSPTPVSTASPDITATKTSTVRRTPLPRTATPDS